MPVLIYTIAVVALGAFLAVFSYLDRIYRELGRVSVGRLHANLDVFEAEIEPRLGMDRRRAALTFSLLAHLWLVLVAVVTARGVLFFTFHAAEALAQLLVFLIFEVLLAMHFIPYLLVTRSGGRWLRHLILFLRLTVKIIWPLRAAVEGLITLAHLSEEEPPDAAQVQQEGIEQLVEAAEEEGILKRDQAELIEQVVEFSDKRVRDVMTPRPDVVAIPAAHTLEQLRRLLIETKFSRIPVQDGSLDEIVGIVFARNLLQVSDRELAWRTVREIMRPALFVPETKLGSQLLKDLQQRNQQMAIVIDEYGSVAGLVTIEYLIEEIVGEIGEEDRAPSPDVVREPDGSLVLRGSVSLEKLQELFSVEFPPDRAEDATTVAGLLNSIAGHVPSAGEKYDFDGLRFEVLEANQRKVLRLRARRHTAALPAW